MTWQTEELSTQTIQESLATQVIGRRVLYYSSLPSTMDIARQAAVSGAAEGTVVIADEQTAGRGRLKRSWLDPAGNVALSVVLYPLLSELPSLIMLASLGVVHSINTVTGLTAKIKWPNDILVDGRKTCGILIETDARPTGDLRAAYAIIGIGINVNLDPANFPEIEPTATSLSLQAGEDISRLALIRALLTDMDRLYLGLKSGASLFEEWRDRLVTLGQRVTVTSVDSTYDGIAESVERDGSLMVRCLDNSTRRVVAGDVTLKA